MKDEAKTGIATYLDALASKLDGQMKYRLIEHSSEQWQLAIEYYREGNIYKDYIYDIVWLEEGCTINLFPSPSWLEPMEHDTVKSLMMYISRYHY